MIIEGHGTRPDTTHKVRPDDDVWTLDEKENFQAVMRHLLRKDYDVRDFWPYMIFTYAPSIKELKELSQQLRLNNDRTPNELAFLGADIESTEDCIDVHGVEALSNGLRYNKYVTAFNLSNHRARSSATALAGVLRNNRHITILILSGNKIDDDGVKNLGEALKVNSSLEYLVLNDNNIGVGGARHLSEGFKKNHTLRLLGLDDNTIGDKGAKFIGDSLKTNKNLGRLKLSRNNIGVDGMKFLAESLTQNSKLHTLDLGGNKIGEAIENLAAALKVNKVLKNLVLTRSEISEDDRKRLFKDQFYFTATFGQDKFGFSLANKDSHNNQLGPYVARLDPEGVAAQLDVKFMDRIKMVNDVPITEDMTFEDCVEILGKQQKPIKIVFEMSDCRRSRIKLVAKPAVDFR